MVAVGPQLFNAIRAQCLRHSLVVLTFSKCAERVTIGALEMLFADGVAATPASVRAMIPGKLLSGNCTLSRIVEFAPGQWFVPVHGSLFQVHGMFFNAVHVVVVSPMSKHLQKALHWMEEAPSALMMYKILTLLNLTDFS